MKCKHGYWERQKAVRTSYCCARDRQVATSTCVKTCVSVPAACSALTRGLLLVLSAVRTALSAVHLCSLPWLAKPACFFSCTPRLLRPSGNSSCCCVSWEARMPNGLHWAPSFGCLPGSCASSLPEPALRSQLFTWSWQSLAPQLLTATAMLFQWPKSTCAVIAAIGISRPAQSAPHSLP